MFLELVLGALAFSVVCNLLGDSDGEYASDESYDTLSEGHFGLHTAADRSSSGIALNNCDNCRWQSSDGSCRWQENCYVTSYRSHQYVCDNYQPSIK